jgi:hypothetical protein
VPDKKIPWISADDLGNIAAKAFANPDKYIGQGLKLASDLASIHEVRDIYKELSGKNAPHFPMPLFMFRMFTGDDMIIMWNYLRTAKLNITTEETYSILPEAQTIRTWLARQQMN